MQSVHRHPPLAVTVNKADTRAVRVPHPAATVRLVSVQHPVTTVSPCHMMCFKGHLFKRAGTFSDAVGASSSSTCRICQPGKYAGGPGSSACSIFTSVKFYSYCYWKLIFLISS